MKNYILRKWYKLIKKNPAKMPMVEYWKTKDHIEAKVTTDNDGSIIMKMDGEKYPHPGFPRGHLLFGRLSKLKHEIKNQIFNDAWAMLEEKISSQEIIDEIKTNILDRIFELAEQSKYDMLPPEKMYKPVKEIYRAWTKVAPSERSLKLRDILCHILSEDDSYRFRVQWMSQYFNPNRWWFKLLRKNPIQLFEKALGMLEHGEVISDMKEKQRLLKRILMLILKDKRIKELFLAFGKEIDWKKLYLSKGDKYHFRGKYFKVDLDVLEY